MDKRFTREKMNLNEKTKEAFREKIGKSFLALKTALSLKKYELISGRVEKHIGNHSNPLDSKNGLIKRFVIHFFYGALFAKEIETLKTMDYSEMVFNQFFDVIKLTFDTKENPKAQEACIDILKVSF